MNPTLAAFYNTHGYGTAARREQVKVAHLELFAKAAAAQGIDLSQLDDGTRNALYSEFTQKLAEEGAPVPEDESEEHEEGESSEEEKEEQEEGDDDSEEAGPPEEKKEARAQWASMRAFNEKVAEADYVGRVMAHAFHDEDRKIKLAAGTVPLTGPNGTQLLVQEGAEKAKGLAKRVGEHVMANKGRYAAGAGAAAALGGGALLAHQMMKKKDEAPAGGGEKKEASAFDVQAARQAVKIASAANWNGQEAAQRLNALLTLGVPAMDKTAQALGDYKQALNVRALELLESSGYPVDWSQVFGR